MEQKKRKTLILRGLKILSVIAIMFVIAIATQEVNKRTTSMPIKTTTQAQVERQTEVPSGYIGIYDAAGLQSMAENLSGKYILMADIDMTGINWTPIGNSSKPFKGILDGNGYTISNLKIQSGAQYVGMFGYIYGGNPYAGDYTGRVYDLNIENITVVSTYTPTGSISGYVGGIVGSNYRNYF